MEIDKEAAVWLRWIEAITFWHECEDVKGVSIDDAKECITGLKQFLFLEPVINAIQQLEDLYAL